ncbi:hypothetical protein D3C75_1063170 [compost metagenome]
MQLSGIQAEDILQQLIGFANELHVAVFNAVVHHFDIVSCTVFSDVGRARVPVHFCRNGCQDRFHQFVGILLTTRHDGRSFERSFFTA